MKLYLGGGESERAGSTLVNAGAKYVSISFVELKKKSDTAVNTLLHYYLNHGVKCILTSGSGGIKRGAAWLDPNSNSVRSGEEYSDIREQIAATGMDESVFVKNKVREFVEYGNEYLTFALNHQYSFDHIVEFDAHGIVPFPQIAEWRSEFLSNGVDPVVVVPDTFMENVHYRSTYLDSAHEYIGLVTPTSEEASAVINAFEGGFRAAGKKFIGIGVTKQKVLQTVPLYAAYSTSWLSGARYKAVFDKDPFSGKLKRVIDSHIPHDSREGILKGMKDRVEAAGIDYESFEDLESEALNAWNCAQWVELVSTLDETRESDYWRSAEERNKYALAKASDAPAIVKHERKPIAEVQDDLRLSMKRACNTCFLKDKGCPAYVPDAYCSLGAQYQINSGKDAVQALGSMLSSQFDRVSFALAVEKIRGDEVLSQQVSEEVERTTKMVKLFKEAEREMLQENIARSDGNGGLTLIQRMFTSPTTASGGQSQIDRASVKQRRDEIRASLANPDPDGVDTIDADFEES